MAFGRKTAYLLKPYKNDDSAGFPVWHESDLKELIAAAQAFNFQLHVHCIGDGAVEKHWMPSLTCGIKPVKQDTAILSPIWHCWKIPIRLVYGIWIFWRL